MSPGGGYRSAFGHLFFKTNDMVQAIEALDSVRNKVSFSVFGFLDGEISLKVYITVRDGRNQEGLAGRFLDPQPEYSAFQEASYGHSTLEIQNKTHALYHWNRNDNGKKMATDLFVLHNQYWRIDSLEDMVVFCCKSTNLR
ncbi:hypothetical protein J1N35_004556 [Gossypium stocksii]|uniref:Purple acid phosphatase C-terminal domain-containing protein n=1 Tax=Gossypium stocksii TaxID=47602 RepID=A0A9D3WCE4_9ROSI|nr:hypothetical protein J1N35_004556 [Gossypium stocksii]